jgi:hypothetical protein
MDWKVIAAIVILALSLVIGLITVIYTSVSKYARRLDPRTPERARGASPAPDRRAT